MCVNQYHYETVSPMIYEGKNPSLCNSKGSVVHKVSSCQTGRYKDGGIASEVHGHEDNKYNNNLDLNWPIYN